MEQQEVELGLIPLGIEPPAKVGEVLHKTADLIHSSAEVAERRIPAALREPHRYSEA
jgi:hypothetical protein